MSGVFSEQGFVDRLVERIVEKFRWVPAWEKWFERRVSVWVSNRAEVNLLAEYRQLVNEMGEATGRDKYLKGNALAGSAQKWALWLLSEEPRLQSVPEEFDTLRPLHPPFPSLPETAGLSDLATALSYEGNRKELEDMTLRMRACVESTPNCLWRTDTESGDLGSLASLYDDWFGSYVTRVGPKTWTKFPDCLTADLAYQLTGTHVCFLEGPETWEAWRRFPQWSLQRLLSWGTADWTGKDGERYRLRLPRFFIVTGPPFGRTIERDLAEYVIEVRTHGKGRG